MGAAASATPASASASTTAPATVDLVSEDHEDLAVSKKRKKDKKKKKKKKKGSPASRRLLKDFKKLRADPPTGINAVPINNNILTWQAVIFGPDESVWESGMFKLRLDFAEEYPNKPPKVVYKQNVSPKRLRGWFDLSG